MLRNTLYIIIFLVVFINCDAVEYKKYSKNSFVMGTDLSIIVFSRNKKKIVDNQLKECFNYARELEKKSSCKDSESIITMLNKKKKLHITDNFILELIRESLLYAKKTDGAFDSTLYHLIDLWGFENESKKIPIEKDILKTLEITGYNNLTIEDDFVSLKNGISLDLGGIAKGKIINEIAKFLENKGYKDFLINGGGDIVVKGLYNGERNWRIAIADPFNKNDTIGLIELTDCSIVTSGDYERYFTGEDGTLYHHIIDSTTGYPAKSGVHSVTVISDDPVKADAYATALFIMGVEKGIGFTNSQDNLESIFISDINLIRISNGLKSEKVDNKWKFELIPTIE